MTTAIDAEVDLAAVPINLVALRSDPRMLTADAKHSAEKGVRHAADQISWRSWDPGRVQEVAMKPLRVLIVEDDLTIGPLLAETLEQLGHVVCALEVDAVAAVSAARRCHPDLMIVDIGLGEASGIAAVEQILKEGFVPHVFVTGDGLRGLPLGPEAVLIQKPYRSSDLVAAIARAIEGKGKRDESGSA
jgi:two-component system, response regulator PdtaR